jgi:hypothetical protein
MIFSPLLRAVAMVPCKLMLATVALSYVVVGNPPFSVSYSHDRESIRRAEFYPLSSFPMYSTFPDRTFLVYVADGSGNPLALEREFQVRAATLRKYYDKQLRMIKTDDGTPIREMTTAQKRPAAEATLNHLVESLARPRPTADRFPELVLHEVVFWREEGGAVRSQEATVGAARP